MADLRASATQRTKRDRISEQSALHLPAFDGLSAVDILLVTLIFFGLMYWLRDTQAMVLLRGVILIVVARSCC